MESYPQLLVLPPGEPEEAGGERMTALYIFLALMFGSWFGFVVDAFCNIAHEADQDPPMRDAE